MYYHNITKDDMLNGLGLRVVLWVSGCEMNCKGCQNPQTHDKESGIPFDEEAEKELFEAFSKPYIKGITFSGGHPLMACNLSEIKRLCKKIKTNYPNKDIWLYTGYTWEELKAYNPKAFSVVRLCDVLCDGRFVEELLDNNKHWVGSINQRVIDVKASLETGKIVLLQEQ